MTTNRRRGLNAIAGSMVLMMLAPRAWAQAVYRTYFNQRYEFAIAYPADLLIPQGEAPNGDGQAFVLVDKTATLKAWGEINAL